VSLLYRFFSDRYLKTGPMKPSQLSVLETVQEVTDFVQIQANNVQFRSLSFLKNLKIIHGRKLDRSVEENWCYFKRLLM